MPFCAKCGMQVAESAAFCTHCGAPQAGVPAPATGAAIGAGPGPPAAAPSTGTQSGLTENMAGLLCYLVGWLTGIIFLVIDKRPFVKFHAAQSVVVFGALNVLQILFGGWGIGWGLLSGSWGIWYLARLVSALTLILWLFLMIKAFQGERFKLPVAGDLAESLAK
jgi:uncharacterized membrane protein